MIIPVYATAAIGNLYSVIAYSLRISKTSSEGVHSETSSEAMPPSVSSVGKVEMDGALAGRLLLPYLAPLIGRGEYPWIPRFATRRRNPTLPCSMCSGSLHITVFRIDGETLLLHPSSIHTHYTQ
jgi:hypothetical protein